MYHKLLLISISLLISIYVIECHRKNNLNSTYWNQITDDQKILESWTRLSQQTPDLDLLTSGLASKLDTIIKFTPNLSSKCTQSLIKLKKDGEKMRTSAIKALESWGRFPEPGFFRGTLSSLGDYDSCLENDDLQYCTVHLRPLIPFKTPYRNINEKIGLLNEFIDDKENAISKLVENAQLFYYTAMRIGICLPTECSSNEIDHLLQSVVKRVELIGKLVRCEKNEVYKSGLDIYAISAIISLSVLIVLATIGTIVDYFVKNHKPNTDNEIWINIAMAFSLKQNFISLCKNDSNLKEFKCLNGLRVITLVWIIFVHTFRWMNHYQFLTNIFNIYGFLNNFFMGGLLNGFLAVDTFFVISGLLTSYITMQTTKGSYKNFNIFFFAISRYLRLTPGVFFSTVVFFLLPYLGSGPFFTEVVLSEVNNCRSYWLANLLYLQTNIPNEDSSSICNIPVWWLSVEMKLHLLSIVVVALIFLKPKLSFCVASLFAFCSILWSMIDHLAHDYPPFFVSTIPEIEEFWQFTSWLHQTYTHVGPFFIGFFIGYSFAKDQNGNLSSFTKFIGWVLAFSSIIGLLFGPYTWVIHSFKYSRWSASFYASAAQTIWALSIGWIIFACVNGFGGIVNTILSLEIFRPFSRTIYMTFLTHGHIIILFAGTRNKLIPLEAGFLGCILIGHIVFSFFYGFLMTLLVESPTLNLIKILVKRTNKPNPSEDYNNNTGDKNIESSISLKLEQI